MNYLENDITELDRKLRYSPYESPIEKKMADALSRIGLLSYRMKITPQAQIGRYRVDLLVEVSFGLLVGEPVRCVVECDGFEFHSTRSQIRRDMDRQQAIADLGYMVARFTGSEIHQDSDRCAQNVFDMMRLKAEAR